MGMIDRYKKPGGFIQLLQLIETCGPKKQEQFLKLIAEDSEVWEKAIKQKMLTIEKVFAWDLSILAELLSRIPTLNLAIVLVDVPEEKRRHYLSVFSQTEQRKIDEMIHDQRPSAAEKATYSQKFLSEARTLIVQGFLKLDKFHPEMIVQDGIESQLEAQEEGPAAKTAAGTSTHAPAASTPTTSVHQRSSPTTSAKATNQPTLSAVKDYNTDESIDDLRKKVNLLTRELQSIKNENAILRDKLDRIRKIA